MLFDLSAQEHDVIVQLLTQELDELASEIHHTDERNYRGELRDRRDMLRLLVDKLQLHAVSA